MEKKSTIQPNLTPLKAFYEKLSSCEKASMNSLEQEVLTREMKLLEVINALPKVKRNPSKTSIDLILQYSKLKTSKNPVF